MAVVGTLTDSVTSFQTRFYSDTIRRSDVQNGVCEVDGDSISLRAGSQALDIPLDAVMDLTFGTPPEKLSDEFAQVFGIKFTPAETPHVCFIEHDSDYADIFEYHLFAEMIKVPTGVSNWVRRKVVNRQTQTQSALRSALTPTAWSSRWTTPQPTRSHWATS